MALGSEGFFSPDGLQGQEKGERVSGLAGRWGRREQTVAAPGRSPSIHQGAPNAAVKSPWRCISGAPACLCCPECGCYTLSQAPALCWRAPNPQSDETSNCVTLYVGNLVLYKSCLAPSE